MAPEEVAGGIAGVMRLLTGHFPHSRVLILGVFPRAQRPWDPPADPHGSFVSFESLPRFAPWNETNPYYSKIRKARKSMRPGFESSRADEGAGEGGRGGGRAQP